jgi:cold-inducible RNA-binding protein
MGTRLYVGNLPFKTTDEELAALFRRAGSVESVRVMRDAATGRARGFAFVQMASELDAQRAIEAFHHSVYEGRALVVNEARPRPGGEGPAGRDERGAGQRRPRPPRW